MNTTNFDHAVHEKREAWGPLLGLSAREVFDLMLGCQLETATVPVSGEGLDVTAMVGLAGCLCGILTLRCKASSAVLMASKMLGVEPENAGPESWDAVAEVCNMVAGNFKNKVPSLGEGCQLSVPTVITGTEYILRALAQDIPIGVTLLFEGHPVIITLKVHR